MSEHKQDEGFKVIDRRPFTAEGEIRKEVVEEQEREAKREEVKEKAVAAAAEKAAPATETPKKIHAFENLVRMIGSNAAMVLGAYADPRTGEPVIDPDEGQPGAGRGFDDPGFAGEIEDDVSGGQQGAGGADGAGTRGDKGEEIEDRK